MEMKTVLSMLSPELRREIEGNAKILEIQDKTLANLIESTGDYYVDRLSETRNCYVLMRRERK